jgi:hypothetical protein
MLSQVEGQNPVFPGLAEELPVQPSLSLEDAINALPFDMPIVNPESDTGPDANAADTTAPQVVDPLMPDSRASTFELQDAATGVDSGHSDDPNASARADAPLDRPLNGEESTNS